MVKKTESPAQIILDPGVKVMNGFVGEAKIIIGLVAIVLHPAASVAVNVTEKVSAPL